MSKSEHNLQKYDVIQVDDIHEPYKCEISVSYTSYDCNRVYTVFSLLNTPNVVVISIINKYIKIEHPSSSNPLHVHIIEDSDTIIVIFVIFNDHIFRIRSSLNIYGDFSFEECNADFSFNTLSIMSSSFTSIDDSRNELVRACFVLNQMCSRTVKACNIRLLNDDSLFHIIDEFSIEFPPCIEIKPFTDNETYIELCLTIESEGTQIEFSFEITSPIPDPDDYSTIFILTNSEITILARIDELDQFQRIGFQIVGEICVPKYDEFPAIQVFVKDLLKLNNYHGCHQYDSGQGSDSD